MRLLSVALVALLAGCSSAPKTISDEQRMEITENFQGLQENYRERLQNNAQDHAAAVSLARVYFKGGDLEAATYYLDQIPDETCNTLDGCWITRADIAYANEDFNNAKYFIDYSLAVQKDVYAAKNLYGIIMATEGDYQTAKRYFFEARLGFKDENAIRNNLAMTEMMEGRYAEAAERLMPLYKKGQVDPTIRANLIVSLMRSEQEHVVKRMLLQEHTEQEALLYFAQLKDDLDTWPKAIGQAITDEEIE
ncbi:hypothetical protein OPW41_08100 [Vibrio europaeus]|uniref:Secretion protein n=1 Tax=Vibrio europaeus TaxID=300876 RepID=A0A178J6B3_9VIBR|nr:hypothetical protein [Vibrio europaeus]MDC5705791.1 hypothetical protein [Vibrio europaeus]MDC5709201.1 hypothetical protein [Vibrio europaeus]MDC5713600.1 hypothetical protein [Vibrio europaeus]MDC5720320.1 hypothetical protein [Vibrio europaeus]MDC5723793.1 hypothetical protein [Vibrio europaeus]